MEQDVVKLRMADESHMSYPEEDPEGFWAGGLAAASASPGDNKRLSQARRLTDVSARTWRRNVA